MRKSLYFRFIYFLDYVKSIDQRLQAMENGAPSNNQDQFNEYFLNPLESEGDFDAFERELVGDKAKRTRFVST